MNNKIHWIWKTLNNSESIKPKHKWNQKPKHPWIMTDFASGCLYDQLIRVSWGVILVLYENMSENLLNEDQVVATKAEGWSDYYSNENEKLYCKLQSFDK